MDPFSALSIATAVVQFVEFGTKVGHRMLLMYDANRLDPLEAFAETTGDLERYVVEMESHIQSMHKMRTDAVVDGNAEAIEKLVKGCHSVAQYLSKRFQHILNDMRLESGSNPLQKLVLFPANAAKAVWSKGDIDSTMRVLDSYRSQIALRMLLMLDIKASAGVMLAEDIRENMSNITEVLAIVQERQREDMANESNRLIARMDKSDAVSRRLHEQVTAAVLTLRSGETKLLSPATERVFMEEDGGSVNVNLNDTTPILINQPAGSRKLVSFGSPSISSTAGAKTKNIDTIERRILNSLNFRQILDRLETVKPRHEETYEWIFCNPAETQKPWDDFADWVVNGSGCYWVCGKAGSGKSTLMKFVYEDPRLMTLLRQWAGNNELKSSSFFFWGLGSKLQKSQQGLLRSMLHDVLSGNPELIPHIMPELLTTVSHAKTDDVVEEPSLAELMRWFRRLIELKTRGLRFFFLIDGIDEYDGDPGTIVEFVSSVSHHAHVKFLLSSRPIPVCVENCSAFPKLYLQDLTRDDIRRYATDTLSRCSARKRINELDLEELTNILVEKSFGVFIWVELCVKSLIRGLENRDDKDELKRRLEELPSDLADLYGHMLRNMSPLYMQQAAQLFRATITAMEHQTVFPTLQMAYLQHGPKDSWAKWEVSAGDAPIGSTLSKAQEVEISDHASGRLRSRCCGLIETRRATSYERSLLKRLYYEFPCVDFLHRTVIEFLRDPLVWKDVLDRCGKDFAPEKALFHACARVCLALPTPKHSEIPDSLLWQMGRMAIEYARSSEMDGKPLPSPYLWRLDAVLSFHWRKTTKSRVANGQFKRKMDNHWASVLPLLFHHYNGGLSSAMTPWDYLSGVPEPLDLATVVTHYGLGSTIQDDLSQDEPSRLFPDAASQSLNLHLASSRYVDESRHQRVDLHALGYSKLWLRICEVLLNDEANPNVRFPVPANHYVIVPRMILGGEMTAWELFLNYAVQIKGDKHGRVADFEGSSPLRQDARVVSVFLAAGADVNARVKWRSKRYRDNPEPTVDTRSAMAVLDFLFRPPGVAGLLDGHEITHGNAYTSLLGEDVGGNETLQLFHSRLMKQMADAGGRAREWRNDVLIRGPRETPEEVAREESRRRAGNASTGDKSRFRDRIRGIFKG